MPANDNRAGNPWPPGSPAAEFEAWLAAIPVELPDPRCHRLRPAGPSLSQLRTGQWVGAVMVAVTGAIVGVTWLLTLVGRARLIP